MEKPDFLFIDKKEIGDVAKELLVILDSGDNKINFSGYMYMRRTALGWRECVPGVSLMGRGTFKCATDIATMGSTISMGDLDAAFNVAKSQNGVKRSVTTLTYPQFVNICWAYNVFIAFDIPVADGRLTRKEMLRGFNDGILPSKMNQNMISNLFNALDPNHDPGNSINFPTFVVLTLFWDKYAKLAKEAIGLQFPSFCKLISDKILKYDIIDLVDSCITGFKDEDLEKASTSPDIDTSTLTEKDYIMLLQKRRYSNKKGDCGKDKKDKTEVKLSKDNREILFNIIDINSDGLASYPEFIVFLKYAYSFAFIDLDIDGRVDVIEIAHRMVNKVAYIPMMLWESDKIFSITKLEITTKIDILEYMAYCFADLKFKDFLVSGTSQLIAKAQLEKILQKMDLKIIKRDLVASTYGSKIPHQQNYNYFDALKVSLQTHARAVQNALFKKYEDKK